MSRHRGITLVFVLVATAALVAQQSAPAPGSDAAVLTVRSGVDAVQVDVFVTDADGMPVRGLTADDFEVFENGKPRPLVAFRGVDIPIERHEDIEQPLAEPDVLSNNGPEGRVYMFVLDEVGDANILRTRRFVRQFIEQHFGPYDVGAVALLGRGLSTDGQDFTSNRRLLLEAVDKFSGGFPDEANRSSGALTLPGSNSRGDGFGKENRCTKNARQPFDMRTIGRSQQMSSLRDLAELTSRLPGQHKAMLIFSECFDLDVTEMIDYNGGTWGVGGDDAHAAMAAATRGNLVIYPIDPTGLSPAYTPLEAIMAFRGVAEITGGFALINSNSFEQAFERIVRENSTYYMLGFDSGYEKTDGRYVRIQVKTRRPGLTVHSRDGYVAPTKKEKQTKARSVASSPTPVASALASPLQTSGVTLRVSAVPTRGRGRNANVAVVTEIDASTLGLVATDRGYSGELDMRYIATDAKRQIFPEVRQAGKIRLDPKPGRETASLSGVRVRVGTTLELPPGRYQIRVAAGTKLTAGNIVYDLKVPDFSEDPLAMSGIALVNRAEPDVLTVNVAGSTKTAKPTRCWSSNCAAPATLTAASPLAADVATPPDSRTPPLPTNTRVFTPSDELQLSGEVYDNRKPKKGAAPNTISVTAAVRDASGRVVQLAADDRATSTSGKDALTFTLPLRLKDVPPGAYALDVTARSTAGDAGPVTQTLPIRIATPEP